MDDLIEKTLPRSVSTLHSWLCEPEGRSRDGMAVPCPGRPKPRPSGNPM